MPETVLRQALYLLTISAMAYLKLKGIDFTTYFSMNLSGEILDIKVIVVVRAQNSVVSSQKSNY